LDKQEKLKAKEERKAHKLALRNKNKQIAAYPQLHPVLAVIARPVIGGVVGYAAGAADAALGTPTNQHWPSFVLAGVNIVGGAVATIAGHPTIGAAMSDASTGPVGWVSGASGFDMVRRRQEAARHNPAPAG